ncbi:MAG: PqqD family peptide modification chaperone [Firmicutes bacterium]|nr:PqqD family peptide modification chaperone [Bacillota bacterium]
MKIELIFPPIWDLGAPYLCLPYLTAALRKNGHEVFQTDLNILAHDYLLSDFYLEKIWKELNGYKANSPNYEINQTNLKLIDLIHGEVDKAKVLLRNSFDFDDTARAERILNEAKRIISNRFYNQEFPFNVYGWHRNRSAISQAVNDSGEESANIFYDYFKNIVAPGLCSKKVDVIGISVTHSSQFIPALTLARLIKEKSPEIYIVLGGALISHLIRPMKSKQSFLLKPYIDFMILGEGETALVTLLYELNNGWQFNKVPGLIWGETNRLNINEPFVENLDTLPCPDFSDFPWDLYMSPKKVVSYVTTRGCYWNKCGFCSLVNEKSHGYRQRKIDLVIDDLNTLSQLYQTAYFSFNDEAISPSRMKEFAIKIQERKLDIKWYTMCRLEKGMTKEVLTEAYNSGCLMISFGLESGCQNVLDSMTKGIEIEFVKKCLFNSWASQIWTHIFVIFGFPGEKIIEAEETVGFIEKCAQNIDSFSVATFSLDGGCPVYEDPGKYNLKLDDVPGDFFGPTYPYSSNNDMNVNERITMINKLDWVADGLGLGRTQYAGYDNRRMLIALSVWGRNGVKNILNIKRNIRTNNNNCIFKLEGTVKVSFWNRCVEDGAHYLVFNSMTGHIVKLNKTSVKIMELVQNGLEIANLVNQIAQVYSISFEQAQKDVTQILSYFIELGIVELI